MGPQPRRRLSRRPPLPLITSGSRCFFGAIASQLLNGAAIDPRVNYEIPAIAAVRTALTRGAGIARPAAASSPTQTSPSPGHRHSLKRPGWPTCSDDDPTLTATRCTTSPSTRSEPLSPPHRNAPTMSEPPVLYGPSGPEPRPGRWRAALDDQFMDHSLDS